MNDSYNLQRFINAQNPVYDKVKKELERGKKTSHWMWYVFPQIIGLGSTRMANEFALKSLEEAKAYLEHPILGARLRECTQLVLNLKNRNLEQIFGYPDHLKFRSSMTLFLQATEDNNIFKDALNKYCHGEADPLTLDILQKLG